MNKNEQVKLINKYYDSLWILNNYSLTAYRDKIYKMSLASEKDHRNWGSRTSRDCGISATTAAKLFTVQYILEGMIEGLKSRSKQGPIMGMTAIHKLRYEYLYGRSVGADYCKDISTVISSKEARLFLDCVDYAKLMEV